MRRVTRTPDVDVHAIVEVPEKTVHKQSQQETEERNTKPAGLSPYIKSDIRTVIGTPKGTKRKGK